MKDSKKTSEGGIERKKMKKKKEERVRVKSAIIPAVRVFPGK